MHHPKGFPSRLVRLRAEAGMTQSDLAKASGISKPQIGRYETGVSTPRITALVKLAKALSVDISELTDADAEPETVEILLYTPGEKLAPMTLPKDLFESVAEDADACGSTMEEQIMAMIDYGRRRRGGEQVSFEQVLQEMKETLSKMPPLPDRNPED